MENEVLYRLLYQHYLDLRAPHGRGTTQARDSPPPDRGDGFVGAQEPLRSFVRDVFDRDGLGRTRAEMERTMPVRYRENDFAPTVAAVRTVSELQAELQERGERRRAQVLRGLGVGGARR